MSQSSDPIHHCPFCSALCPSLVLHMPLCPQVSQCVSCKGYITLENREHHDRLCLSKANGSGGTGEERKEAKQMICRFCGFSVLESGLKRHYEGCEKAFCCLNCSGFVPVQDKNRHLQVCPAALKVTCKVCGLALPTSELDDHEISHQIAQFSTLPRKKPQSASISAPRPVPEAIKRCQFCYLRFPASEIRNHKANCPKSYFCPNCQRPQRYSTFELHARICKQPNGSFQGDQWTCGVCRQGMNSQCKG